MRTQFFAKVVAIPLVVLMFASGCTTYAKRVGQMRQAYYANDIAAAEKTLAESLKRDRQNSDVLKLDKAMIELASGEPQRAERTLKEVRDQFEKLDGPNAQAALSYLTDDSHRTYAGEDYEKILLLAFLSLCNLMSDGGDAEAYALQMMTKQEQIIANGADKTGENPKAAYQRVALAPYLRGVLRESTHRDYDDAQRSYVEVVNWQPNFRPGRFDVERATHGTHSQPGNGVLFVFAMTGRGPVKEEVVEEPTSASLLIAGEILSAVGKQTVPPNVAPVKVPKVVASRNAIQAVGIAINGQPVGPTETITDVTQLAIQQHNAVYSQIIARAVARRCVKMGIVYGAKESVGIDKGSLPGLAVDLTGIAWEAMESADTRCWGLLPDRIQVLRLELPAGEYNVGLCPLSSTGTVLGPHVNQSIRIVDGRNTYALANFPERSVIGRVLVSQH